MHTKLYDERSMYIYIRTVLRICLVENINILDDTVTNGKTIFYGNSIMIHDPSVRWNSTIDAISF